MPGIERTAQKVFCLSTKRNTEIKTTYYLFKFTISRDVHTKRGKFLHRAQQRNSRLTEKGTPRERKKNPDSRVTTV